MTPVNLYSRKQCYGIVVRPDGAWWIDDGELVSGAPAELIELIRYERNRKNATYQIETIGWQIKYLLNRTFLLFLEKISQMLARFQRLVW